MTEQSIETSQTAALERTSFRPAWLIKIVIMFLALAIFGTWGLYDALVVYPARGEGYAEFAELQYLQKLEAADAEDPTLYPGKASIDDPAAALAALSASEKIDQNRADAGESSNRRYLRAQMELAQQDWLTGLSRIGALTAARTVYPDRNAVRARQDALKTAWSSKTPPSALQAYDIPSQWLIMGVSYAFAAYIAVLFIRVASVTYKWDPSAKRLHMPGGATLVPSDLTDFDKRKWDKFIVFITVRNDHDRLGGKTLKFDTYRHAHLEEWLLEMEAVQFPDQVDRDNPEDGTESDATADADADADAQTPASSSSA